MLKNNHRHYPAFLSSSLFPDLTIRSAGCYAQAEGHYMERVRVTEYQAAYCTEGAGRIRCAGKTKDVYPGCLFINIPGHPHRYEADKHNPWTVYWVHFAGTSAPRYFALMNCKPSEPAFFIGLTQRLIDMYEDMLHEVSRPEQYHQITAVAHAHLILATIISMRIRSAASSSGTGRIKAVFDLEKINHYLDTHIANTSLAVMAGIACLSIPHFERLFKERTGYSPLQYAIRRKITGASSRICLNPSLSIKEAALSVGIDDQHYFSRIFKKSRDNLLWNTAGCTHRREFLTPDRFSHEKKYLRGTDTCAS